MAKVTLAIADRDEFFVDRFSRYILEHNNMFDVLTFTDETYLLEYLRSGRADILLIDKGMQGARDAAPGSLIIFLSDFTGDTPEGVHCVNKYQKTEGILKEVTFLYAESIGDRSILGGGTGAGKVISVYSPAGGSGKTTISLAIATGLVKMGLNTVYLNLERFNSSGAYLAGGMGDSLSEIFLKLKNNSPNLSFEIMKALNTDSSGIRYFTPPESAMEFSEMSEEEIITLIKETTNLSDINSIVVDMHSDFSRIVLDVFNMSDRIVYVTPGGSIGVQKAELFHREMDIFPELNMAYQKFVPVINMSEGGGIPPYMTELFRDKEILACVPRVGGMERCTSAVDIGNMFDNYLINVIRLLGSR